MTREEICTYEVAKLAKEKGFPQDVFGTYEMKRSCYLKDGRYYKDGGIYPIEDAYTAPTQSLLQRWLREEKMMHIEIAHNPMYGGFMPYICKIVQGKEGVFTLLESNSQVIAMRNATYEEALEAGLQYVLEHFEQWNIKEE